MKRILVIVFAILVNTIYSQDVNVLFKEASNFERSLKDEQALEKYKAILTADPANTQALIKSSEILCAIGARQVDKKAKSGFYNQAKENADKALATDSNSADANYVRAVVANKLTEVETENKLLVADLKDVKTYADKALAINPDHGKANYVLGKWNYDILNIQWAKKAAIKVLFGGMPDATIENAIDYMEKCKKLEPYYVRNFLDLAKAYKFNQNPAKAIEVLNQLTRLPIRTADDVELKAEGKKLLADLQ